MRNTIFCIFFLIIFDACQSIGGLFHIIGYLLISTLVLFNRVFCRYGLSSGVSSLNRNPSHTCAQCLQSFIGQSHQWFLLNTQLRLGYVGMNRCYHQDYAFGVLTCGCFNRDDIDGLTFQLIFWCWIGLLKNNSYIRITLIFLGSLIEPFAKRFKVRERDGLVPLKHYWETTNQRQGSICYQ